MLDDALQYTTSPAATKRTDLDLNRVDVSVIIKNEFFKIKIVFLFVL